MMTTSKVGREEQLNLESLIWGNLTWVNIEGPTVREAEYLAQNYQFHPLDLEDCLVRVQRSKIDEYKNYLFLVFHFPIFDSEQRVTTPSQVAVFIGENYIITLHKGELKPLVKLFRECQIDEESRQEYFGQGSGYLLYRIIDRLIDYCFPILNKIIEHTEQVEDRIFSERRRGTIEEISVLRRDIISFRRIIWPMRAVIGSLESKTRQFTTTNLAVYYGDTIDHVDKIWDALDEYKEVIEGLKDTHDSLAAHHTNEVVRILTVIATILLPITVVSSVYGMNIPLPFQHSGLALLYVALIILAIIGSMLYYFRRQHWI